MTFAGPIGDLATRHGENEQAVSAQVQAIPRLFVMTLSLRPCALSKTLSFLEHFLSLSFRQTSSLILAFSPALHVQLCTSKSHHELKDGAIDHHP